MIEKYKNILFNLVPDISLALIILLGFIIGGIIINSIITSKLLKQKGYKITHYLLEKKLEE